MQQSYDTQQEVEIAFNKSFAYQPLREDEDHPADAVKDTYEEVDTLLAAHKRELNEVKSLLNNMDICEWRKHTNYVNPSCDVIPYIHRRSRPELATKAWCKFHELLCSYGALPGEVIAREHRQLNCVHLCEAPGGFVSSINHYLRTRDYYSKIKYAWMATSLNPYYESNPLDYCITDDRLISHTLNRWCFGDDNTGDIFHHNLVEELRRKAKKLFCGGKINLITGDGGFNCQEDPANQERATSQLMFAQTHAALSLLCEGGNFVLKMFTMFERSTVELMYLLRASFSELLVVKPATSKCGNSEVYVIGRGYKPRQHLLDKLHSNFPFDKETKLFDDIPREFTEQHVICVNSFKSWQIHAIKRNLFYFNNPNDYNDEIMDVRRSVTQLFEERCELQYLNKKNLLLKRGTLRHGAGPNIALRPLLVGSYSERVNSGRNEVDVINSHNAEPCACDGEGQGSGKGKHQKHYQLDIVYGRTLDVIHSSLYCDTRLIVAYSTALAGTDRCEEGDQRENNDAIKRHFTYEKSGAEFKLMTSSTPDDEMDGLLRHLVTTCNDRPGINTGKVDKYDAVMANLVPTHGALHQHLTDELQARQRLLTTAHHIASSGVLKHQGKAVLILPSSLTRLTSHCLWTLSFYFNRCEVDVIRSTTYSALLFVATDFRPTKKSDVKEGQLLKKAAENFLRGDYEIMQLYTVTSFLSSKVELAKKIKTANEKCLLQRMQQSSKS